MFFFFSRFFKDLPRYRWTHGYPGLSSSWVSAERPELWASWNHTDQPGKVITNRSYWLGFIYFFVSSSWFQTIPAVLHIFWMGLDDVVRPLFAGLLGDFHRCEETWMQKVSFSENILKSECFILISDQLVWSELPLPKPVCSQLRKNFGAAFQLKPCCLPVGAPSMTLTVYQAFLDVVFLHEHRPSAAFRQWIDVQLQTKTRHSR